MVTSRRERPAKAALTRRGIIGAALGVLRDEGLRRVTMRRVAEVLDTGHASLYVYVRNTEDLHAQILDALLEGVAATGAGDAPWRDRLKALLLDYSRVLRGHPEIARMALSTSPSGDHFTAIVEQVLTLLAEGGVTGRAAAWGLDLLLLYPNAVAVEHGTPKASARRAGELAAQAAQVALVDAAQHPRIALLADELFSGEPADRADFALDVLLDGIVAAQSRRSSPSPSSSSIVRS